MHSLNYSDGMHTIDDIVQYAGKIWLKKMIITDHSQFEQDKAGFTMRNRRSHIRRWKNMYNDTEVLFGVEWDLVDDEGNCCFDIQWEESDFCILSCHAECFKWDLKNITQAYINAIHTYHERIKFIGHIWYIGTSKYLDVDAIAKVLNQYQIPIELNCYYLYKERHDYEKFNTLLSLIEAGVYVNSDMHTLNDFSFRQAGFDYLKEQGFVS